MAVFSSDISNPEDEPILGEVVDDPEDRVGFSIRLLGIPVLILGLIALVFVGYVLLYKPILSVRAILASLGVGAFCIAIGFTWLTGRRYFAGSENPENDTLHAGRAGMFETWPKKCQQIIDRLRPVLLAQRAVFFPEDKDPESDDRKVRIGWPGVHSSDYAVMAVVRPNRMGGLELSLRVGTNSDLLMPKGPLKPQVEGIAPRVSGFGAVILSSTDFPPEVLEWIASAGRFTRKACNK